MVRHFVYLITPFREETETLLPYEMYKPSATHAGFRMCGLCWDEMCVPHLCLSREPLSHFPCTRVLFAVGAYRLGFKSFLPNVVFCFVLFNFSWVALGKSIDFRMPRFFLKQFTTVVNIKQSICIYLYSTELDIQHTGAIIIVTILKRLLNSISFPKRWEVELW